MNYRYAHNSVLAGIKHLNRLEQVLARSEWTDSSIAEGVVLDHEENVIEGTMSNVFYIKGKTLYTPELSACGVDGIIRRKVITLATELHLEICINKISLKSLMDADEIFMCNSVIGVWPIKMLGKSLSKSETRPFKLKRHYKNIISFLRYDETPHWTHSTKLVFSCSHYCITFQRVSNLSRHALKH